MAGSSVNLQSGAGSLPQGKPLSVTAQSLQTALGKISQRPGSMKDPLSHLFVKIMDNNVIKFEEKKTNIIASFFQTHFGGVVSLASLKGRTGDKHADTAFQALFTSIKELTTNSQVPTDPQSSLLQHQLLEATSHKQEDIPEEEKAVLQANVLLKSLNLPSLSLPQGQNVQGAGMFGNVMSLVTLPETRKALNTLKTQIETILKQDKTNTSALKLLCEVDKKIAQAILNGLLKDKVLNSGQLTTLSQVISDASYSGFKQQAEGKSMPTGAGEARIDQVFNQLSDENAEKVRDAFKQGFESFHPEIGWIQNKRLSKEKAADLQAAQESIHEMGRESGQTLLNEYGTLMKDTSIKKYFTAPLLAKKLVKDGTKEAIMQLLVNENVTLPKELPSLIKLADHLRKKYPDNTVAQSLIRRIETEQKTISMKQVATLLRGKGSLQLETLANALDLHDRDIVTQLWNLSHDSLDNVSRVLQQNQKLFASTGLFEFTNFQTFKTWQPLVQKLLQNYPSRPPFSSLVSLLQQLPGADRTVHEKIQKVISHLSFEDKQILRGMWPSSKIGFSINWQDEVIMGTTLPAKQIVCKISPESLKELHAGDILAVHRSGDESQTFRYAKFERIEYNASNQPLIVFSDERAGGHAKLLSECRLILLP